MSTLNSLHINTIPISTQTIIVRTNINVNIGECFKHLPITKYIKTKKKRGRKTYIEKVDYNKDLTDSSTIKAHFVGETTNYSTTINKNFSSMIIVETGFDLIFEDGWNIKTVFSRIDKNGLGHENNFEIRAVKNK